LVFVFSPHINLLKQYILYLLLDPNLQNILS
jgi:hypothetical protein